MHGLLGIEENIIMYEICTIQLDIFHPYIYGILVKKIFSNETENGSLSFFFTDQKGEKIYVFTFLQGFFYAYLFGHRMSDWKGLIRDNSGH